jgi:hypothetical protein
MGHYITLIINIGRPATRGNASSGRKSERLYTNCCSDSIRGREKLDIAKVNE